MKSFGSRWHFAFRSVAMLVLGIVLLATTGQSDLRAEQRGPVLVELYTSQGCNSCPPADKLLGKLASREGVIALTFNVDYWDYLGWKDTLAHPDYTERQRQYAQVFHSRTVYTPQMVIGGRQHAVGSDAIAVAAAIEAEQRHEEMMPALQVTHVDGLVKVSLGAAKGGRADATIWLVRYDQRHDIPIERGENAGSKLSYHNVVRDMRPLGHWRGQPLQMELSRAELQEGGRDGCAIIVQEGPVGPVLAAARIDF